jgi:hypothetical protein
VVQGLSRSETYIPNHDLLWPTAACPRLFRAPSRSVAADLAGAVSAQLSEMLAQTIAIRHI